MISMTPSVSATSSSCCRRARPGCCPRCLSHSRALKGVMRRALRSGPISDDWSLQIHPTPWTLADNDEDGFREDAMLRGLTAAVAAVSLLMTPGQLLAQSKKGIRLWNLTSATI